MSKDLIELRDKEVTLLRNISRNYKNSGNNSNSIIYYGVIEEIDRIGNDNRQRYSALVRLLNIDPIDRNFKAFRWYAPLLSTHAIVIPEINEEVKIILENPTDLSKGYWISRNDTKNTLTRTIVGENLIDTPSESFASKYGIEEDISKRKDSDIEPNHEYKIPINRDKPGDVIQGGRSNTEIRHSFDSDSKKGYIELSTEKQEINDSEFYNDDFVKVNGGRIVISTESDLDTKIIEKNNLTFHKKFQGKNSKVPYSLIEADEIRFISKNGKNINHTVLAEKQSEWLEKILDLIGKTIDVINDVNSSLAKHTHMGQGPTSPPLPPELNDYTTILTKKFNDVKTEFLNEKKTISEHHSKNIAIN